MPIAILIRLSNTNHSLYITFFLYLCAWIKVGLGMCSRKGLPTGPEARTFGIDWRDYYASVIWREYDMQQTIWRAGSIG